MNSEQGPFAGALGTPRVPESALDEATAGPLSAELAIGSAAGHAGFPRDGGAPPGRRAGGPDGPRPRPARPPTGRTASGVRLVPDRGCCADGNLAVRGGPA